MKKYFFALILLLLLAGCSNGENTKVMFTDPQAVSFDLVHYEEKIAPIFESLVPHIAYAETQAQFDSLKARFQVDNISIDMDEYMAVFVVTYSGGCGIAVDGVYNHKGILATQLLEPKGDACAEKGVPHTFVLQVEKNQYEKVQLYNGNIIKSSADVE